MTTLRFLNRRTVSCALVGASVLLLASFEPAAAQFLPPPGQTAAASQGSRSRPPQASSNSNSHPVHSLRRARVRARSRRLWQPIGRQLWRRAAGRFRRPAGRLQPAAVRHGPSGGGGQPSEAQKICLTFPAIREDVEKGAAGIRAAGERKAAREEVCPLFKVFAAKEAKLVGFLTTNQKLCGVPANIIAQLKQNHAKTIQIRNNVCSTAPTAAAAVPSLSEALARRSSPTTRP